VGVVLGSVAICCLFVAALVLNRRHKSRARSVSEHEKGLPGIQNSSIEALNVSLYEADEGHTWLEAPALAIIRELDSQCTTPYVYEVAACSRSCG